MSLTSEMHPSDLYVILIFLNKKENSWKEWNIARSCMDWNFGKKYFLEIVNNNIFWNTVRKEELSK